MIEMLVRAVRPAVVALGLLAGGGGCASTAPTPDVEDREGEGSAPARAPAVAVGAGYIGDGLANLRGGLERGATYQGLAALTLEVDTEAAGLWPGGRLFAHGLQSHHGDSFSERFVGDLQVASNIDAPDGTRLYELWFEQAFLEDRVSVLVGQHDFNSELAVTDNGTLFLNSSFGIGPDLAANAPFSIFPVAGPAARVRVSPGAGLELLAGIYDGDPGDPRENDTGLRWSLSKDDGALFAAEAALRTGGPGDDDPLPGAFKLGAWFHTGDFEDFSATDGEGAPRLRSGNRGLYLVADQMAWREQGDQGLGFFVQAGGAPRDRNEVAFYLGIGATYRGPIRGRDQDEVGLAVGRAWISSTLRRTERRDRAETAIELTYRAQVAEWLSVQPSLQLILDPGADPELDDALAALLRFELAF